MSLKFPDPDGPLGEPHAATEIPRAIDRAAVSRIAVPPWKPLRKSWTAGEKGDNSFGNSAFDSICG
jgi:hypothetical protein